MTVGPGIFVSQDFISRVETQFWLSSDFANGCRTLDLGGHTYDMSVRFSHCRVYIDSSHLDTLGYE
jgi:hypothetical protein